MLPKPPSCHGCPLYGDGRGFVPDEIVEGAEVFTLFQNPGHDEEAGRRLAGYQGREAIYDPCAPAPLLGRVGYEATRYFFPIAGLERGKVSIGNVLRCRWIRNGRRTNDLPPAAILNPAMAHCMVAHLRIPSSTRLVVAAGALAFAAVGGQGSVTNWRGYLGPRFGGQHAHSDILPGIPGRRLGNGDLGLPTLITLHIAEIFHDPRMRLAAYADWNKVRRFLAGTWPVPHPPFLVNAEPSFIREWFRHAQANAPFLAVDTEFERESHEWTVIGVGYPGMPQGLQLSCRGYQATHDMRQAFGEGLVTFARTKPVVFQNAVADLPVLKAAWGLTFRDFARLEDTMLAHAVLWSEWPHDLGFLASLHSPYAKRKHLAVTDIHAYNAGDVCDTIPVWQELEGQLQRDPQSARIYREQSIPLIPVILRRHANGLRVNQPRVLPAQVEYLTRIAEATRLAQAAVGWPLNLGSSKQRQHWLYTVCGYPVQTAKKTRQPTTDDDAISTLRVWVGPVPDLELEQREGFTMTQALARVDEGADPILEARVVYAAAQQAESHYIRPFIGRDGQPVERIYPVYKIHAQASGRWSITDPPLPQFPHDLRDLVCPDVGHSWIEWDWDQAELRIIAAIAGDEPLLQAFREKWDVHTLNCCDIFGLPYPPDRIDPHQALINAEWRQSLGWNGKDDKRRLFSKRFVYRQNYGGDPSRAGDIPGAKALGMRPALLNRAAHRFLAVHPALSRWRAAIVQEATKTRASRTFMGRLRRLLGAGKEIVRQAFDHPMQGGVTDIANTVVVQVSAAHAPEFLDFMKQAHDSQTWQTPTPRVAEARAILETAAAQVWNIGGRAITIPATFKVTEAPVWT